MRYVLAFLTLLVLAACNAYPPEKAALPASAHPAPEPDLRGHRMQAASDCEFQTERHDGFTCVPASADFGE